MISKEISKGLMTAARVAGNPKIDHAIWEFRKLTSDEARSAFVDKWTRIAVDDMNTNWVMLYESLKAIKESRIYENASLMEDHKARSSFEEYWTEVVRKPFATWVDLELTYRTVHDIDPDLLGQLTYGAATAHVQAWAERGLLEPPLPKVGEIGNGRPAPAYHADDGRESRSTNSTSTRGQTLSYLSRRIARDRPDILERMKSGGFPSVRASALEAGIVEPSFQCPNDPLKASRRLLRHFTGDVLVSLLTELANHAGYDLVAKE